MGEPDRGREQLLITSFVGLADTLVDDDDIIDLLDRLVSHSVELLAAESAGILLADAQRTLRVVASTNEQTEWTELLQLQADEGPSVECVRTGGPVSVTDLADVATRWLRAGQGFPRPAWASQHGRRLQPTSRLRAQPQPAP